MTVPFFTFGNLSRLREFDLCWASQFLADFGAVARPIRLTAVTTLSLGSWAAVEVLLPPRRAKKDACLTSFFFNYLHGSADMPGKQAAPPHSIRVVGIYAEHFPSMSFAAMTTSGTLVSSTCGRVTPISSSSFCASHKLATRMIAS